MPATRRPRTDAQRIAAIHLEEPARIRLSATVENERKAALYDLINDNRFVPSGDFSGPYEVHLAIEGERLVFDIRDAATSAPLTDFSLPLRALRRLIKDYFLILDSYFKAIRDSTPSRIETIDMARRGLHNEGAELLRSRLADDVEMDADTARRLFTLLCVLQIRN